MEENIKRDSLDEVEKSEEYENLMNIKNNYEPGSLVLYRDITDEQMNIFLNQLSDSVSYKIDILRKILDDDKLLLIILDVFSGESINIPNRKQLFQCLDRTFMYTYVKHRGFTEEAYIAVAKHFGEKLVLAKQKVLRVSKVLDGAEYESLFKAQEKLKKKRKKIREQNRLKREQEENSIKEKEER